jgi:uncharacterized integral membrane protein
MKTSFWVFIIAAILLVVFSVQNADNTNLKIFIWSFEVSKAVLIIATFLAGLVTGAIYAFLSKKGKEKSVSTKPTATPTTPPEETEF